MTSGGGCVRDVTRIDESILGVKRWESLDLGDLTVEIVVMLRLPRSLEAINSGPNSAKTLCYLSAICSETRVFSRPIVVFRLSIRLMLSSLSRPTSSFAPSYPSPMCPSSSSSSWSLSSGSSTTDSLSVGAANVPHLVEVVRGDDLANVVDQSDSPSKPSPEWSLVELILK